jgi:hypothetical protein
MDAEVKLAKVNRAIPILSAAESNPNGVFLEGRSRKKLKCLENAGREMHKSRPFP